MSLFSHRMPLAPSLAEPLYLVGRAWLAHRRNQAARASLERLLDRSDDHLLDDVGIDRETALRLLDEGSKTSRRDWDRWQI